jgi:hypothetical protein
MEIRTGNGKPNDALKILASMIDDPLVLSRVSSQWDVDLFATKEANQIADWCVKHFRKHGDTPGNAIRDRLQRWEASEALVETTTKLLKEVWRQREHGLASDYVLDLARDHFDTVRYKRMAKQVLWDFDNNNLGSVRDRVHSVRQIDLGQKRLVDLKESSIWKGVEKMKELDVIQYRGDLGKFFDGTLGRGSFVAVMAADKTGKSFVLLDAAMRAVRQKRRVAFFECGDLTEQDVIQRIASRITKEPLRPCSLDLPTSIEGRNDVRMEKKQFVLPMTAERAHESFLKHTREQDMFRLSVHPCATVSVEDIHATLCDWKRETGWVADFVCIDYSDILAPPKGVRDTLDQIDTSWQQMRRMSQYWHCLVMTASQTNAQAYKNDSGKPIRRTHFSGRKTKLAHVTGMFGIACSDTDRQKGLTHWNWVVRRSGKFSDSRQVTVAGNLGIACPTMRSAFCDNE